MREWTQNLEEAADTRRLTRSMTRRARQSLPWERVESSGNPVQLSQLESAQQVPGMSQYYNVMPSSFPRHFQVQVPYYSAYVNPYPTSVDLYSQYSQTNRPQFNFVSHLYGQRRYQPSLRPSVPSSSYLVPRQVSQAQPIQHAAFKFQSQNPPQGGHGVDTSFIRITPPNVAGEIAQPVSRRIEDIGEIPEQQPNVANLPFGLSYDDWNFVTAIIGQMHSCVQDKRKELIPVLKNVGYSDINIQEAFDAIITYGGPRRTEEREEYIGDIVLASRIRSIYTYIIKKALLKILDTSPFVGLNRESEDVVESYRKRCEMFLIGIEKVLKF